MNFYYIFIYNVLLINNNLLYFYIIKTDDKYKNKF